jgi:hypothetical protein
VQRCAATELGGKEVTAAVAGQANGEAVLSIHVATDGRPQTWAEAL